MRLVLPIGAFFNFRPWRHGANLALIFEAAVAGGRSVSTRAFYRRRVVVFAQKWEVEDAATPAFGHGRTAFAHPPRPTLLAEAAQFGPLCRPNLAGKRNYTRTFAKSQPRPNWRVSPPRKAAGVSENIKLNENSITINLIF